MSCRGFFAVSKKSEFWFSPLSMVEAHDMIICHRSCWSRGVSASTKTIGAMKHESGQAIQARRRPIRSGDRSMNNRNDDRTSSPIPPGSPISFTNSELGWGPNSTPPNQSPSQTPISSRASTPEPTTPRPHEMARAPLHRATTPTSTPELSPVNSRPSSPEPTTPRAGPLGQVPRREGQGRGHRR